jgi:hypothetical protein
MPWPVAQQYIDEAEAALGVHFPRNFVARMRQINGGEVTINGQTWWLHPFWDKSDRKRLARTSNDIVRETNKARQWAGFPAGGVAIAHGLGPEQLVLLPSEKDPHELDDTVYDWDPQYELEAIADSAIDLWIKSDPE